MKDLKAFIEEMKAIRDEVTHGDLQAMVEAYTMQYGGDDDEILAEIENG